MESQTKAEREKPRININGNWRRGLCSEVDCDKLMIDAIFCINIISKTYLPMAINYGDDTLQKTHDRYQSL